MKTLIALTLAIFSITTIAFPVSAAFTEVRNFKISVNIPESVQGDTAEGDKVLPAESLKEEKMTIMERVWRDSQILLVKTTVVK